MTQKLERRTLLRGAGTLLALPLLEAMMPLSARAVSPRAGARRIAFMFVPNGANMEHWTPKAEGAGYTLTSTLEALKDVYENMNVLTGLTQHQAHALGDGGGDHARSAAAWLTGCHPRKTAGANIKAGVSADQIAAQRIGRLTRFPSLELSCERGGLAGDCDSGYSCAYSSTISWRTENTPVARETNPRLVFERLFGGMDDNESAEARAHRIASDRSVLDFVQEDANSLRRTLGMEDRRKLEEYFAGVREVEQRVAWLEKQSKEGASAAPGGIVAPVGIPQSYDEHIRLMGDMMILAFQADLTRVATFMLANEGSNRSYRLINIAEGHHELSHHGKSPEKLEKIRQINRFHADQVAYVVNKMKTIREGSGTLLDNTLLVYGGGISDGDRHNHDDLPLVLIGGQGMGIKGGRHIKYKNGTPMTNLFLTMFDKVGIPADTVGTIGDSTGRLAIV
jgi:hypothetical protein